jgi:hypothetical protein
MESIQHRASREIGKWGASAKHDWYNIALRIKPPRFCRDSRINYDTVNKRLFKSVKWTLSEVRRKLNDGEKFNFFPFWGGDTKNGVGIHIHALIEIPKNGCNPTAFASFFQSECDRLSQKAFRSKVNPTVWVEEVIVSNEEPLSLLTDYFMRREGEQFGKGTEKLITELLQRRDA